MTTTLKNHPVWQTLNQTLEQLDTAKIAVQHLQACNSKINGYWDEDEFYEAISFTQPLQPQLMSSSWEISSHNSQNPHWLRLKFSLLINFPSNADPSDSNTIKTTVGDLILILDENLEVIDENWLIDVHSSYVLAN
ncbi:MAG: hypothetical protein ACFBSC_15540 [Microcoleaceae cyanobacterium]